MVMRDPILYSIHNNNKMFRATNGSARSYNHSEVAKAKIISAHKDQLMAIMSNYIARSNCRDTTISALGCLKDKIKSTCA